MDTIRLPDSVQSQQPPSQTKQRTKAEKKDYNPEVWHIKFRGFSPSERSDPVEDLKRISELCFEWLRPDLNSKEQILDQLVLEQFMICMPPELQALAKESRVKSCRELEKMLRERGAPRQWSIIHSQGQLCLLRDATVELPEASKDKWDGVALFQKHLNRGQAIPELQNLSQTEEPSTVQFIISRGQSCHRWGFGFEGAKAKGYVSDDDVILLSDSSDQVSPEKKNLPGPQPFSSQGPHGNRREPTQKSCDLHIHRVAPPSIINACHGPKQLLYLNTKIHSVQKGIPTSLCRICSKVFAYKSTLIGHNKMPMKEKPYQCEPCGKCDSHKGSLSVHLQIFETLKV